jgi:glycosyltransferase involved in cell wall biosynthesis
MQPSEARILEIGDYHYCKDVYPDHTTLLWTGWRAPFLDPGSYDDCTPQRFLDAMNAVQAGRYDVLVAYFSQYSPFHPRNWLRTLVREPTKPVAALTRGFGVAWLRYPRVPVPIAALDMGDAFLFGLHNLPLLDRAAACFKRELPVDRWRVFVGPGHPIFPSARMRRSRRWQARVEKLQPITLPVPSIDLPEVAGGFPEKTADLFCAVDRTGNSFVRQRGLSEIAGLAQRGIRVDSPEQRLPREEYWRRMSRAWLTWSPEGLGWQCYRHGEAPQCLSVPIISRPTVERDRPLVAGEHAFYYDVEPGGLTRAVEAALRDKERLRRMATAGREYVRAHHTERAVVDRAIDAALNAAR